MNTRNIHTNTRLQTQGFTIMETLIALAILLVGVGAVFGSAQIGLHSAGALRNRITASYLASEAMNGVKNIKNTNLLRQLDDSSVDWLENITFGTSCVNGAACGYDGYDPSVGSVAYLVDCGGADDCIVKIDEQDGTEIYRQGTGVTVPNGTDTDFTREIVVTETIDGREAKVEITVTKPGMLDIVAQAFMYNLWRQP